MTSVHPFVQIWNQVCLPFQLCDISLSFSVDFICNEFTTALLSLFQRKLVQYLINNMIDNIGKIYDHIQ